MWMRPLWMALIDAVLGQNHLFFWPEKRSMLKFSLLLLILLICCTGDQKAVTGG